MTNPELKAKADEVTDLMYKFYCLTSAYLDGPNKESRATKYKE